ncbi:MAG: hypothetical protein JXR77_13465, partial [Lentisphaeria bacterium]|nr:hypothetical protein [Lentisphaeria bacterium]
EGAGGGATRLTPARIGACAAKFQRALQALEALTGEMGRQRGGRSFDLELSIDEVPAGVGVADVLTTPGEIAFLVGEFRRRGLPVTHVAPNLGIEKGADYRLEDGLEGLERRTRSLHGLLREAGLMLDCHSGDDLGGATRRTLGRATDGCLHFKISPSLQILFAEVLRDEAPSEFRFWWEDALAYARREAAEGSALAARLLAEAAGRRPDPHVPVFHQFCFATVGRRSAEGAFLNRHRFYSLPEAFYREYTRRVVPFLTRIADDLYGVQP